MSFEENLEHCWEQHTIIRLDRDGDVFHLNHSCLSSLSFGSEDMAWTTDDLAEAEAMLKRVEEKHADSDALFMIKAYE